MPIRWWTSWRTVQSVHGVAADHWSGRTLPMRPPTASIARPRLSVKAARPPSGSAWSEVMFLMCTATGPPFEGGATCGCARSVSPGRRGFQHGHGVAPPLESARTVCQRCGRRATDGTAPSKSLDGAHLGHQTLEHRVGIPADHVDRWPPHLPPLDQAAAEQGPDQLKVKSAVCFQRAELLEKVKLPIQDVGIHRVLGDKSRRSVPQLLGCLELCDQAARLHQRVFVPAPEKLNRGGGLAADAGFACLPGGEDHRADRTDQPDGPDRGRDRCHLLSPVRHGPPPYSTRICHVTVKIEDNPRPTSGRGCAGARGSAADNGGMPLRLHHIVIDTQDLPGLARFWTQALGWKVLSERDNEIVIGTDESAPVGMCFMPVADPKTVKNRVHLDLTSSSYDRDQEIDRLLALGARRVDIGQTGAESWTVLADPEGNEFCVVRPKETLIR